MSTTTENVKLLAKLHARHNKCTIYTGVKHLPNQQTEQRKISPS